ncbi:MAG: hypothetical protein R3E58_07045 [Phycisphaerae bacterium]|nr:hypothetical protein [Phycisphaerales bacterium]
MKRIICICGILFASFGLPVVASAQESGGRDSQRDKKFSDATKSEWNDRHERIQHEIESLPNHEWAGSYYHGDGLGVNASLTMAPSNGFVFVWTGCMGVYDRNYGDVTFTDQGTIQLTFEFVNDEKGFQGVSPEFMPIAWGERHYLIEPDRVIGFCNSVNSGREPREGARGFYFLRRGDESKPVDGMPPVDDFHKQYMPADAIKAQIIEVGETTSTTSKYGITTVTAKVKLNVGSKDKVLPGMEFELYAPDVARLGNRAKVLKVSESSCDAEVRYISTDKRDVVEPKVGWKYTTGSPWAYGLDVD